MEAAKCPLQVMQMSFQSSLLSNLGRLHSPDSALGSGSRASLALRREGIRKRRAWTWRGWQERMPPLLRSLSPSLPVTGCLPGKSQNCCWAPCSASMVFSRSSLYTGERYCGQVFAFLFEGEDEILEDGLKTTLAVCFGTAMLERWRWPRNLNVWLIVH